MTNVETLKANHYEIGETGGGCTAWVKNLPSGKDVLIGRDGSDNVDENDKEYKKLKVHITAIIQDENHNYINVVQLHGNIQYLINFVIFLDGLDQKTFAQFAEFEPTIHL